MQVEMETKPSLGLKSNAMLQHRFTGLDYFQQAVIGCRVRQKVHSLRFVFHMGFSQVMGEWDATLGRNLAASTRVRRHYPVLLTG